uniref:Uncharacterized protein n=1 Tax=Plectus sambesii TaxID=2011161 RepID=A0A914UK93_9BILA
MSRSSAHLTIDFHPPSLPKASALDCSSKYLALVAPEHFNSNPLEKLSAQFALYNDKRPRPDGAVPTSNESMGLSNATGPFHSRLPLVRDLTIHRR